MATAKTKTQKKRPLWLKLVALLAIALAALFWTNRVSIAGQTQLATSYGARIACACQYIGGRDLKQCKADFEPGMGLVFLTGNSDAKSVTATIPLLASATASYRPGYGCVLEEWRP